MSPLQPPVLDLVGHWKSVADSMPDDQITCLAWSTTLGDAVVAYHDASVFQSRRGKTVRSGWVSDRGRVIPGVTHYCDDIIPPRPAKS